MESNVIREWTDSDILTRQLRLINDIQTENLVGSWERGEHEEHIFWSDSMFSLHELPINPGNLIAVQEADSFIYEKDLDLVRQKREELEYANYADFYLRINTPDGKQKRIHARERKVSSGETILYQGSWQDEVREKENQQPLKDQNNRLNQQLKLFHRSEEVAGSGSWQVNLITFETVYSDNIYRIHGLPPQSITPHVDTFRKFIHPADRAIVLKTQEKAYQEKIPLHLEYRIIREDGEERYINQVSHLLKNEKGEHVLAGSTHDITEQKMLEIQLREANDILSVQNELFMHAEKICTLGSWQFNLETRKSIFSANMYRLFGLKPHSVQPGFENFVQYIHSDDRDEVRNAYAKAIEENIAPDIKYRIVRADGKLRTLRQEGRFIKSGDNEQLLIGIVHDITEKQEQEKLLREINEKLSVQNESFRQAEKLADIGSWTWHLHTNEMIYSDNVYIIYGLKPQSAQAGYEHFGKYVHSDDRERMKAVHDTIRELREPLNVEYRIIRQDGELRYLRSRSHPITTGDGQTIIIGTMQDISEEVMMQQQLLDKIRFAEVLGDSMPDRIIVTDAANNILSLNKTCESVYKLKKEQVQGKNFFDVFPQVKLPPVLERFKRALSGETIHLPVMQSFKAPGYHELLMVPLRDEQGSVSGILHVMHDITRQQQLQEQLTSRLQFIEKLQEASIDRIMVLDADLYFQLWNKQCEQYYDLSKEHVIGKNILEVFPKFKTDPLYRHCLSALEGETVHVPANEREGLAGYQESYFIPLKNEVNHITGVLWIMHDLTERFISEKKLRISEAHLKTAEDLARLGSWEYTLSEGSLFWSDGMFRIYGYAPQTFEPTLKFFLSTIHPDDRSRLENIIETADTMQEEFSFQQRIFTLDARMLYVQVSARPVADVSGNITAIIGTALDITQQRLSEEEMRRNAARMRLQYMLDRQAETIRNVGTWQLNIDSGKMIWGESLFRLLGYKPFQFEPDLKKFINTIYAPDRKAMKDHLDQAIQQPDGLLPFFEYRIDKADQGIRYFRSSCKIYTNQAGRSLIGTLQDVTEDVILRKQLAELNNTLEQNNKELQEMNEELSSFAFVASHDLREPLRKVQVFSRLINESEGDKLSEKSRDYFKRMLSAVQRMDHLIDDILNFSRISTSSNESVEVNLDQLLKTVKADMIQSISKTHADIQSDPLPSIYGTHSHIYVLFQNLLSNALKYQQPGNVPVVNINSAIVRGKEVDHPIADNDTSYARITFSDNGIGFEEQYSKKIFQMFQRLHGLHEYPGTGMGLAICKKIIEHHNGFIIARSVPGEGAAFECYFPIPENGVLLQSDVV
ncbi:MAG: PAS domain-containing protein [Chitinophagaceae bacterium]